jgi:formylglycine-generating enzyme required for sulfatase activity
MSFAWIPPGSFLMGSPATEPFRDSDETQHPVTLTRGFYLGVHPVTQAEWQAVTGSNPSRFAGDDRPVERVSWNDCQSFLRLLRARDGRHYRLPGEAEWEYACRGGTTSPFHFGRSITTDQANFDGNYAYCYYDEAGEYVREAEGNYREETTPVGSFPPNAFGLYDMHGNVWEWVQDVHGLYPDGPVTDPGPHTGRGRRLVRGGCWFRSPWLARSAERYTQQRGTAEPYIGLRVAFSPG